ncbi:hypothetical protein [Aeoliella sp.]|uniref:hypothetical protein n=1 Tax=Aeoliella sp. TaxID=2795800 RepID=UPI003CCC40AB
MAFVRVCAFVGILAATVTSSAADEESADEKTAFGRRQVEQMLDDRPDMRGVIPESHPLFTWVVTGFNGDRFGRRVYWLADSPRGGYPSMHIPPYEELPPFIQLSAGAELTPVDRWASVIFELHNLQGLDQSGKLVEQAMSGELTGEQYAMECVRLEYEAGLRSKEQLLKEPIPEPQHKRNPIYHRILSLKPTFEEHQADLKAKGHPLDNFDYFLDHYRRVLVPAMQANQSDDKAASP